MPTVLRDGRFRFLENLANKIRKLTTKKDELQEYSGGYWPAKVREKSFELCNGVKGRLLEAGCGEGLFLKLFTDKKELELFGLDTDKEHLNRAGNRLNVKVKLQEGDAKNLPFENNFFDAVICINMIYCLENFNCAKNVISELSRVCKKGGFLIIDIRNKLNPLVNLKYKLAKYYDSTVNHPFHTQIPFDVFNLLKGNGFEILKLVPIGFPLWIFSPVIIIKANKIK